MTNPARRHDLILRGGHVIDPASGRNEVADIAISGGKIRAIRKGLKGAKRVIDVTGKTVLPGLIDNPRGRGIVARQAAERGISVEEREAEFLEFISLKCWIDPAEVGDLAVFLASDAGRHITAQEIGMDGNVEWEI